MADFIIDRIRFRWKNEWVGNTEYIKDDIVYYKGNAYVCLQGHTSSLVFVDDFDPIPANSKWEKWFEGGVWRGDWDNNTYYTHNDIVKYYGYVYRCLTEHTSVIVETLGLPQDIEKWEILATTNNWVYNWAPLAYYNLGDTVRYNGYLYVCTVKHRSAATQALGLENDQAKWTLLTRSDSWLGDWDTSYRYRSGDVVKYGGRVYRCLTGHTSAETITLGLEDDQAKWEIVISGVEYKFDWTAETRYKLNDIVKYGASLFICVNEHTSGENSLLENNSAWQVWIPGLFYEQEWDNSVEYQRGDIVKYGGYTYTALNTNVGSTPSAANLAQDTGNWELLKQGYRFVGEWNDETQYLPGDVVTNQGYLYIAVLDIVLTHPDSDPKWQLLVPGKKWKAEWFDEIEYSLGDVVTYEGTAYTCIARHTANGTNDRPDVDVDGNWIVLIEGTSTNVLTYRGDLRTHDGATPVRLPIGTPGNLLKSIDNSTVWQDFFRSPKVYYVSPEGTDAEGFGNTINSPFRTIKYACEYILEDEAARAPATIFIKTGFYEEITPISIPADVALVGDELRSTVVSPASSYEQNNMFFVRNGSGIRNMTLQGLSGTLGEPNEFGTRRPSAGAYVSLDPGNGPNDSSVWITTRSPYIQNVTTFGTACVGMKIDGILHNGGNRSIVANDFTQVLSDGIGYWAANSGLSELVSVFTYFCHIGYLSTTGGKLRGTNGNNSYGLYGSVSEGFNPAEDPINALVDNRSKEAQVHIVENNGSNLLSFGYSHAGQHYTSATPTIIGSGYGHDIQFEEFRSSGISELRLTDPGDSSIAGGLNYTYLLNSAQGGDVTSITLAAADTTGTPELYVGQRLVIVAGKGVGQYGYITGYDAVTKVAVISRESDDSNGWDTLYPGYPIETALDSSTRYSIEPRVRVSDPSWSLTTTNIPINPAAIAGKQTGEFVAVTTGTSAAHYSSGSWSNKVIPSGNWAHVDAGPSERFLALSSSNTQDAALYAGTAWTTVDLGSSSTWVASAYNGNTSWIAVSSSGNAVVSTNLGSTWAATGSVGLGSISDIAYGNDRYVAITTGNTFSYSTNNGSSWTTVTHTAPIGIQWTSITYGNGRFVAVGDDQVTLYSFDGATWYEGYIPLDRAWVEVQYSNGLFVASNSTTDVVATSQDGRSWTTFFDDSSQKSLTLGAGVPMLAAGLVDDQPVWLAGSTGSSSFKILNTGATAFIRAVIASSRVQKFVIYDPGSGYLTTPAVTIIDNSNTIEATYSVRINSGALAQPLFKNRGLGYVRSSATISGDGYADIYQLGSDLVVKNLTRVPGPGDNLEIDGISDVVYRITVISDITGTEPNLSARLTISPTLDRAESPNHETEIVIRQQYSQIRLTGHDFLDIGTGNKVQTDYPDLYLVGYQTENEPQPFNETVEKGGGRVFYTSTDQDGNFRVGEYFAVEQATGIVSVNASYFDLTGLTEISLGGIQVGGSAVVVREFSKDQTFAANSNNIVPTQRAIAKYLESRITGGGSNAVTNALIAGQVRISGANITTTSGLAIEVPVKMNIPQGADGHYLASMYFAAGMRVPT